MVDFQPFEDGELFRGDEEFDASCDAGLTADEADTLECEDHLVNRRWADAEVALHVGFGR